MPGRRKVNPDVAREMRAEGKTLAEIAAHFRCATASVSYALSAKAQTAAERREARERKRAASRTGRKSGHPIDLTGQGPFGSLMPKFPANKPANAKRIYGQYWSFDCLRCGRTDVILPARWALVGDAKTCGCGKGRRVHDTAAAADWSSFPGRLQRSRLRAGYRSAGDFGVAAGVARSVYIDIEAGRRPPTVSILGRIAAALSWPDVEMGVMARLAAEYPWSRSKWVLDLRGRVGRKKRSSIGYEDLRETMREKEDEQE